MNDKDIRKICEDLVKISAYRDGNISICVNCFKYDGKHFDNCGTKIAIDWLNNN